MSQADPAISAAAAPPEEVKRRSWWTTLPGVLTAAAGLISAITGLIVAIQQLVPSAAPAGSPPVTQAQVTTPGASGTSAAGTQARAQAPTDGALPLRVAFRGGRRVEIGPLGYDVLSAAARPANPGQLTLALQVRMTNGGVYDANFWNRTFRLQTAAGTSAPTNFLDDLVHGGTTDTAEVDFSLTATTRTARLLVGDDPAHAIALPIVLSPARG